SFAERTVHHEAAPKGPLRDSPARSGMREATHGRPAEERRSAWLEDRYERALILPWSRASMARDYRPTREAPERIRGYHRKIATWGATGSASTSAAPLPTSVSWTR